MKGEDSEKVDNILHRYVTAAETAQRNMSGAEEDIADLLDADRARITVKSDKTHLHLTFDQ